MSATSPPSPRCRALLLELSRYLDGELTPSRRRAIARHIDACECCHTMSGRLRATIEACRAESGKQPPRAIRARAAARIKSLLKS